MNILKQLLWLVLFSIVSSSLMARDKDHRRYLKALENVVSAFHFTSIDSPRALPAPMLRRKSPKRGSVHASVESALSAAALGRPDLLVIAGSFLLVGDAMRHLGFNP